MAHKAWAWLTVAFLLFFSSAQASININVDAVERSVVFLYAADATGAVDSNKPIGTAFFVEIPLISDSKRGYRVLVTARHMVDPVWAKCPTPNPITVYARLNKKDYKPDSNVSGIDFVKIDLVKDGKPLWHRHSDENVDAAVIEISAPSIYDSFDTTAVPIGYFPTDAEISSESIGDPAMSAGLLPGLTGKSRNYPIFKFGQISNIPGEVVETHCGAGAPVFPVKVWLVAANLVAGNSGSPIFHVPLGGGGVSMGGTRPMLIGVQSITFGGADVAGMTPVKYVYEILQNIGFPDVDLRRGPLPPTPPSPAAK
jgi:hypothetical protein